MQPQFQMTRPGQRRTRAAAEPGPAQYLHDARLDHGANRSRCAGRRTDAVLVPVRQPDDVFPVWGIERTKDSGVGVLLLLAFTFFMGLMLSRILQVALGFSNGGSLIAMAAGGTGVIFFSLAGVATVTKKDFSFLGKFLFVGMIVVLLAAVANIFFQIPALSLTISAIAVMVFSAYILYDISRIVTGGEDNYISATLAVYLDIYNVFVSLLNLLMVFSGDRD
jgi:modulator of FtsH protease